MQTNVKDTLQIVIEDYIRAEKAKKEAEEILKKIKPQLLKFYGDENVGHFNNNEFRFNAETNNSQIAISKVESNSEDVAVLTQAWNTMPESRQYMEVKLKLNTVAKSLMKKDILELTEKQRLIKRMLESAIVEDEPTFRVSVKTTK